MPTLTGAQVGELKNLLVDAFKLNDLIQVVHIRMNIRLGEIVAISRPFLDVCYDFIEWLEHRNRTKEFLAVVRAERSSVPEVLRFCDPFLVVTDKNQFTPGPPPDPDRLLTLVVEFRLLFGKAQVWFRRLGSYKALHDVLHKLQFQHMATQLEVHNFRAAPNEALKLRIIADSLEDDLVTRAKQALPSTEFPEKSGRWVGKFEQAVRNLRDALEPPNMVALDRAVAILGTLPNQQADLNGELVSCAKRLETEELVRRVEGILAGLDQDSAFNITELRDRLSQFKATCERLAVLTLDHDICQELETYLAQVNPTEATAATVFNWTDLFAGVLRIAARRPDDKAASRMVGYARKFDAAAEPKAAATEFTLLREQFKRLFYKTDEDLLSVTEQLVENADKLGAQLGGFV